MSSLRHRVVGNPVARTVLSVWAWIVLAVCAVVWLPLVAAVRLATIPFDQGRYWPGLLFRKLAVVHQRLNPLWRFRVTGERVADPRRPYVVVSNHESFVDILLISHLPFEMKWLSKSAFFQIPFVGWLMRLAGDIPVVRGERESALDAMEQCRQRLRDKVSVIIFPEGTRSADGEMGRFRNGAFRLAIETGTPILPLAVHGTRSALRKHDWRFGVSEAEVRVLAPIPVDGLTSRDVNALRKRAHELIAAEVASMRDGAAVTA